VCDLLERIPSDTVVQRIAVDVPGEMLVGPEWCIKKRKTMAAVQEEFKRRNSRQGILSGDAA